MDSFARHIFCSLKPSVKHGLKPRATRFSLFICQGHPCASIRYILLSLTYIYEGHTKHSIFSYFRNHKTLRYLKLRKRNKKSIVIRGQKKPLSYPGKETKGHTYTSSITSSIYKTQLGGILPYG